MSSQHAAQQQSSKTRPEGIGYYGKWLEIVTSTAVLKKGPGQTCT